jgi:predicted nucleic acid-binding protein
LARLTLVDAGPLVAFLHRNERHHRWSVDAFRSATGTLATCEAVLTEACFLLGPGSEASDGLIEQVETGRLRVEPMGSEARALRALMKKYRDVPMSYADACLVRLSEKHSDSVVVTLDRDFEVYRRNGRQVIPVVAPFRGPHAR